MLPMPACEQARILKEQKHPKQRAAPFRRPYYMPALATIRDFYRSGGSPNVLVERTRTLRASRVQRHRKDHNLRVITQFSSSDQAGRSLAPVSGPLSISRKIGEMALRLRFDLVGEEQGEQRYIFYHFSRDELDEGVARNALEIAH